MGTSTVDLHNSEAVVEFDYDSQHSDELSIRVGDVITELKPTEPGWMMGRLHDKVGVFPDNFVKIVHRENVKAKPTRPLPPSPSGVARSPALAKSLMPVAALAASVCGGGVVASSTAAGSLKSQTKSSATTTTQPSSSAVTSDAGLARKQCVVVFDYSPQKEDELELRVDDVIDVLDVVEAGWWKGTLNGKVGVFPSNFVEPYVGHPSHSTPAHNNNNKNINKPSTLDSVKPKPTSKATKPCVGGSSVSTPGASNTLGRVDKHRAAKDTPPLPPPPPQPPQQPTVSCDTTVTNSASGCAGDQTAPELPPKPVREQCRVLFAYQQQNSDELSLAVGDIVTLVSRESEDKGWWRGELAGKIGVFPDNFVELLPSAASNSSSAGSSLSSGSFADKKPVRPEKPVALKPPKPASATSGPAFTASTTANPAARSSDPPSGNTEPIAADVRAENLKNTSDNNNNNNNKGCGAGGEPSASDNNITTATTTLTTSVPTASAMRITGPVKPPPPPILHAKPSPALKAASVSTASSASAAGQSIGAATCSPPLTAPKPAFSSTSSSSTSSCGGVAITRPSTLSLASAVTNSTSGPVSLPACTQLLRNGFHRSDSVHSNDSRTSGASVGVGGCAGTPVSPSGVSSVSGESALSPSDEFNAVERGSQRLSHITAARARRPGRRPHNQQQQQQQKHSSSVSSSNTDNSNISPTSLKERSVSSGGGSPFNPWSSELNAQKNTRQESTSNNGSVSASSSVGGVGLVKNRSSTSSSNTTSSSTTSASSPATTAANINPAAISSSTSSSSTTSTSSVSTSSPSSSASAVTPAWKKQLQQNRKTARADDEVDDPVTSSPNGHNVTSSDRDRSSICSTSSADIALSDGSSAHVNEAESSAVAGGVSGAVVAPWVKELQQIQARAQHKRSSSDERINGDTVSPTTSVAKPCTAAKRNQESSTHALKPNITPPVSASRTKLGVSGGGSGGLSGGVSGGECVAATRSSGNPGSDNATATATTAEVRQLRAECDALRAQLDQQVRCVNETVAAVRADCSKRIRTILDELDSEKKARLMMQVQLDRLDKLVKNANFTV